MFSFVVPETNLPGIDTSTRGQSGIAVSDGFWIMLKPLEPGKHTIHFEGACLLGSPCSGFTQNVTYEITVTP